MLYQLSYEATHWERGQFVEFIRRRYELNKLTSLPMCGFIAQLVEHRTGIAEVTGSNPVEALIFFRLLLSSCLNWKIHCEDHSSLSSMTAVQIYELFHIYLHNIIWSIILTKLISSYFCRETARAKLSFEVSNDLALYLEYLLLSEHYGQTCSCLRTSIKFFFNNGECPNFSLF